MPFPNCFIAVTQAAASTGTLRDSGPSLATLSVRNQGEITMPDPMPTLFAHEWPSRPDIPQNCITITGSRDGDTVALNAAVPDALSAFPGKQRHWLLSGR